MMERQSECDQCPGPVVRCAHYDGHFVVLWGPVGGWYTTAGPCSGPLTRDRFDVLRNAPIWRLNKSFVDADAADVDFDVRCEEMLVVTP